MKLQKLTYLVIMHVGINHIDIVRTYTSVVLFVEVEIELSEDLPLKEAHDIGEILNKT